MTISEIKKLTKFLTDEEVDNIKEEIKSKESILKKEDMDEDELGQVLNTLFAILVIEKTLESEIEGIEEIREELEQELMESYQTYDSYMDKYKKEDKKKKKRWLLDFLFLSDRISSQKEGIGSSKKTIDSLKKELNTLKEQRGNNNLKEIMKDRNGEKFDKFCNCPHECKHPHYHEEKNLRELRAERRHVKHIEDIMLGRNTREMHRRFHESNKGIERKLNRRNDLDSIEHLGTRELPKSEARRASTR